MSWPVALRRCSPNKMKNGIQQEEDDFDSG